MKKESDLLSQKAMIFFFIFKWFWRKFLQFFDNCEKKQLKNEQLFCLFSLSSLFPSPPLFFPLQTHFYRWTMVVGSGFSYPYKQHFKCFSHNRYCHIELLVAFSWWKLSLIRNFVWLCGFVCSKLFYEKSNVEML